MKTSSIIKLLISVGMVLPFVYWLYSVGDPAAYFSKNSPDGQLIYAISKLLGLYALALLWLQFILVFLKGKIIDLSPSEHIKIGAIAWLFMLSHFLFFLSAVAIRGGQFHYEMFFPLIVDDFYKQMVAVGALAFWLFNVVIIAGIARKAQSSRRWASFLHKISALAFVCVFIHGYAIGTESSGVMATLYWFYGISSLTTFTWVLLKRNVNQRLSSLSRTNFES